jgi:hypothetical protein
MTCLATENVNYWNVPLGGTHSLYSAIEFVRSSSSPQHTIILVNTKKFIQLYENNCDSLKPVDKATNWDQKKLAGIAMFLKPSSTRPTMPKVSFEWDKRPGSWKNLWRQRNVPVLTFVNGRHRVRYLEYAGANCFPVEVRTTGASALASLCGA